MIRHIPLPVRAIKQSQGGILSALPWVDVTAGHYQPKNGAGNENLTRTSTLAR